MRVNIPSFRLPAEVLDEEVGYILDMGVDVRYEHAGDEHARAARRGLRRGLRRQRRAEGEGSRHPGPLRHGPHPHRHRVAGVRALRPHRKDRRARADHRRRQHGDGLLPHVAPARRQGHQGHGAALAASTSRRRPGSWRTPRRKAVQIVENHAPKRFIIENGKLVGMEFERLRWFEENGKQRSEVIDTVTIPCDDVILAIGQENAFPWIERDIGHRVRQEWTCRSSIARRCSPRAPACSSAATRRGDRRTSSGRWSTDTRRRSRFTITARASRSPSVRRTG